MLGIMAPKYDKNAAAKKYCYSGKWFDIDNKLNQSYFNFAIVKNWDSREVDFNNMTGKQGEMIIVTKSQIPFKETDIIHFLGVGENQKYTITTISKDLKSSTEFAFLKFKYNANIETILILRKAG